MIHCREILSTLGQLEEVATHDLRVRAREPEDRVDAGVSFDRLEQALPVSRIEGWLCLRLVGNGDTQPEFPKIGEGFGEGAVSEEVEFVEVEIIPSPPLRLRTTIRGLLELGREESSQKCRARQIPSDREMADQALPVPKDVRDRERTVMGIQDAQHEIVVEKILERGKGRLELPEFFQLRSLCEELPV